MGLIWDRYSIKIHKLHFSYKTFWLKKMDDEISSSFKFRLSRNFNKTEQKIQTFHAGL